MVSSRRDLPGRICCCLTMPTIRRRLLVGFWELCKRVRPLICQVAGLLCIYID